MNPASQWQPAADVHEVSDLEAAVELCYDNMWTDGLPVIPPTPAAVDRILRYLGRDPQEVIGIIAPRDGVASVEAIAINCVMAGCKPEYVPIVIAAVEVVTEPRFNLNAVQTTTHSCAPLIVVSGPAVREMKFNTREGTFGHGCRASAAIGRALRLILWNIGGGYPGDPCKTTQGHPGYYSFCIAEDPDTNPWEPLQVERGFEAGDTVVTVAATEGPHTIGTGAAYGPPEDAFYVIADEIAVLGRPAVLSGGDLVLVLSPMAAKSFAEAGLSKTDVKNAIAKLATRPVKEVRRRRSALHDSNHLHWSHLVDVNDPDAPVPFVRKPENLVVVVAGGWGTKGAFSSLCPGWGEHGGRAASRKVVFPEA